MGGLGAAFFVKKRMFLSACSGNELDEEAVDPNMPTAKGKMSISSLLLLDFYNSPSDKNNFFFHFLTFNFHLDLKNNYKE